MRLEFRYCCTVQAERAPRRETNGSMTHQPVNRSRPSAARTSSPSCFASIPAQSACLKVLDRHALYCLDLELRQEASERRSSLLLFLFFMMGPDSQHMSTIGSSPLACHRPSLHFRARIYTFMCALGCHDTPATCELRQCSSSASLHEVGPNFLEKIKVQGAGPTSLKLWSKKPSNQARATDGRHIWNLDPTRCSGTRPAVDSRRLSGETCGWRGPTLMFAYPSRRDLDPASPLALGAATFRIAKAVPSGHHDRRSSGQRSRPGSYSHAGAGVGNRRQAV